MAQFTIEQAFHLGLQHHQAGRLPQAEQLYRQILAHQPNHAEALHHLGLVVHQAGQKELAVDLIRQAIAVKPNSSEAHNNLGNALKSMGQLDAAIAAYRQAIALKADNAEAYNNLGIALWTKRQSDEAVAAYRRAITINPRHCEAHVNLGDALKDQRRLDESIAAYRQAIALRPNFPEAHRKLGLALKDNERLDEAIAVYRQAISLRPGYAETFNNLGDALKDKRQLDEAIAAYRQAIALRPNFPAALVNLGNALTDKGQLDDAIAAFREAIALRPNFPEAHSNLGNALLGKRQLDEAVASYQKAIALRPDLAEAHLNLGNAFRDKGQLDESIAAYRQAIALDPDLAMAHNNLGGSLKETGQLDEAVGAYRRAMALKPQFAVAHSNLIYVMHFHPGYHASAILEEACRYNDRHALQYAAQIRPWGNDPDPERPLRIGYVSPNLRQHTNGLAMLPLLNAHDHARFRIFCYSDVRRPDAITAQCRAAADEWRNIVGLSDEEVAELVRNDQIDILVDLNSHMADNRLLVFARKPAPVQTTYLCNQGPTGLGTMDYRISDPHVDPPGVNDAFYTEKMVRVPDCYLCFQPLPDSPPVNVVPALRAGYITFGSLNNFCKVTPRVLDLWSRILAELPNSRLMLRCPPGESQQRVRDVFVRREIATSRVGFCPRWLEPRAYLELHDNIDIYLDPFPHAGHTTTMDALWMGVPLITLAGQTSATRGGVFLLANLGLDDLIAHSEPQYMEKAIALARDLPRLGELRSSLRGRMEASPLMDAPRFARNVEAAYRRMWREWCSGSRQLSPVYGGMVR